MLGDIEELSFQTTVDRIASGIYDLNVNLKIIDKLLYRLSKPGADVVVRSKDLSTKMALIADTCSKTGELVASMNEWPPETLESVERNQQRLIDLEFQGMLRKVHEVQHKTQVVLATTARAQRELAAQSADELKPGSVKHTYNSGFNAASVAQQPSDQTPLLQVLDQLDEGRLSLHNGLIEDRELEIAEIQRGMSEINAIFRDISTLVREQGSNLDTVEDNLGTLVSQTANAGRELSRAEQYQRSRGKWSLIALLVLLILTILVALSLFR